MTVVIGKTTIPAGVRGLPARVLAVVGLVASFGLAPGASANLRAPLVIPEFPSSALSAPAVPLTVEGEQLTFLCGADACTVTARYAVSASARADVRLEFILPAELQVTATINSDPESVRVAPASPLRPEEARTLPLHEPRTPRLFRAVFQGSLRQGSNTVTVRYSQPLGAEEVDYGYFRKRGRMVSQFRYELWPLREWTRSPGFRVKVAVAIDRPAPGWWKSRFGHPRSVACLWSDTTASMPAGRLEQRGSQLWYEAELGPSIPDRITCFVGDEDLMPRH